MEPYQTKQEPDKRELLHDHPCLRLEKVLDF